MDQQIEYAIHVMGMDSSKFGGMERFNVALSRKLEEEGIRSVFIYESFPESQDFVNELTKSNAILLVSNSRKHPLRFCMALAKLIFKYRPKIVHAHFTKARFYAVPIAKLLGTKRVFFTIHSRMDSRRQIKPLTRAWYEAANKIAKVIAVSDDIASTYRTNWPTALVKRIYLGVNPPQTDRDSSRRYLSIPEGQFVLLTIANFNHIKGLDILVKAVSLMVKQGKWPSHAYLYIVGQPKQDIDSLKTIIDSFGIGHLVKMQGITNEVAYYLGAADLYIQPSRSEGLPLALMEAASHSLPLIGSHVGGIPEIIKEGENGLLVPPENEDQLAEAIYKLMQDPNLRGCMGHNSHALFKNCFSIENGVNQTIDYYCS